ncbi:MAG: hypothetical protein AUI36_44290 [Cyanobacteria bacterium 13_1_40CM_2_61_4]|nr:MAG: hypothetical protein AUI36_44290 [Cyanobacteria bacterium 13_1_40CM_2_61_4]
MGSTFQNGFDLSAEEKRALLADLLREKTARAKTVPTSFAQQRLWFLSRLEPDSPAYNIPRPLRIHGELNVSVLRQTFNGILARHAVLRGSFDLVAGEPVQLIAPHLEIDLPVIDLEVLTVGEREAEVSRLAIADAERPFDLTQAPLLRLSLLRLSSQEHVLLLTMHHIISDGWSMGILVGEMTVIYQALNTEQPINLPELQIQYADFARWQREWLQGEMLDQHLSYWTQQLGGAPAVLDLPVARPRPATQTMRGSHFAIDLSSKLTGALVELSRREGVTLFMTLLAAFQTLLYRYSGQEDLVIGTPIAGRNRAELEGLIGFFVNSLPLRTNLSGNPSFRRLLRRVRETALSAYAHQDLPFEKIVEAVQPPRSLSYPPIFQVMFVLQNQPAAAFSLPGLSISPLKREFDTAKYDLTLFMTESNDTLSCWLEYNTDLFEESTVRRLLEHFETLLASVVANPDQRIALLPLLKDSERQQLLVEWNDTQAAFPRNHCIHQLFEQQVERTPDAVAVVFKGDQLTYRELNTRANRLAHYLRAHGVGPEVTVGICVERSFEMIVGLLGILKAGGAYLPLDPSSPQERLSFMLGNGGVKLLLTVECLRQKLPTGYVEPIALDSEWETIARESRQNPDNESIPEHLAYVIYTSGSTGRPKGASVVHRSVARLVKGTNYAALGPEEVFLQFAPLSFDASTFEIWGSLLNGARLVMMPPGVASLSELGEAVKQNDVTTLWLTAGLFPLSAPHVEKAARELSGCQLINGYGPTENTTFTCCYRIKAGEQFAGSVPIGSPISNTIVFILDQNLEPMPVGVAGELYIGGDGLARGYLNDASLTAEKFVPSPFGEPGSRLYRTGDRSRYLADGHIEFLGRLDRQVKIRGYRIEPGEIESVLAQHPRVSECAVVAQGDKLGDTRLAAYIVPARDYELVIDELRSYLKEKLPEYMVPAYLVELEKLPLTPHGKVDTKALPEPTSADLKERFVAPRSEIEQRLVSIWTRVLGRAGIGVHDNFFELGGHSLLAVRLMSEVENEFGCRVPLVTLFQTATIEGLAAVLGQDAGYVSWPTLIEIQKGGSAAPLFCVSMPNVNALGYLALARQLGADQPVYGLQAQYPEDYEGEHSEAAVDELATDYLNALRAVRPKGPYQFIGMCRGAHIAFEMVRRLEAEGEKVALLGILDTWVIENTYNQFLYIKYYFRRFKALLRLSAKDKIALFRRKLRSKNKGRRPSTATAPLRSLTQGKNPLQIYFPGPEFVPRTYNGSITVFRVRRQPLDRIRDKELGWGKLAIGGVELYYVPGKHGASVLREPNVRGLAEALKKCLLSAILATGLDGYIAMLTEGLATGLHG